MGSKISMNKTHYFNNHFNIIISLLTVGVNKNVYSAQVLKHDQQRYSSQRFKQQ